MPHDTIVIGAGTGGLVAACLLARAGRRVLVLEARNGVGGVSAPEEFYPGFRSPLLHRGSGISHRLIDTLELSSFGLRLTPPSSVYAAGAAGGVLLAHDPASARAELARISGRDADRYVAYRAFFDRIRAPITRFLEEPPPRLFEPSLGNAMPLLKQAWDLRRLGESTMLEVLRIAPMAVADTLNEWFETPFLKAALAMPAVETTFGGPWSPGTAANLLLHECTPEMVSSAPLGVFALEQAARGRGVEIRLGAPVDEILVDSGKVRGVRVGTETIEASAVVSTCDPRRTFLQLISPLHLPEALGHRIHHYRGTGLTAIMRLAVKGPVEFQGREKDSIARARFVDDFDALERAFDPAKYDALPDTPSLDVYVPSIEDPKLAPSGHHVISIHARCMTYRLRGGWTNDARMEAETRILRTFFRYAPTFESRVVAAEFLSPLDLEERYGLVEGHLHHGDHAIDQILVRPSPECMDGTTPIQGLYLCGGGVHPGVNVSQIVRNR
ncbi:MAG TPA: NAD(P)/FAD-dependent oxidoreductase [Candidatus Eisenbacteria bacterium]|nr:NAD(P)/FAD-dependent oxidoreductase [Candidatus Eisenbacteria bacterium]